MGSKFKEPQPAVKHSMASVPLIMTITITRHIAYNQQWWSSLRSAWLQSRCKKWFLRLSTSAIHKRSMEKGCHSANNQKAADFMAESRTMCQTSENICHWFCENGEGVSVQQDKLRETLIRAQIKTSIPTKQGSVPDILEKNAPEWYGLYILWWLCVYVCPYLSTP